VSNAEKQPTHHSPEGCDENGPAAALLVGHVSIQICSAPRALPAAHFDRNESHAIYGTGHLGLFLMARWLGNKTEGGSTQPTTKSPV
jgi:hypothetical protein